MLFRSIAAAVGLAIAALSTPSFAQSPAWPSKPITLIVPQAPGGGTDVLGRLWADFISKSLNATIVVENKAGANGVIASAYLAKQPADGHTIMVGGISTLAFNPFTYKALPYNPAKDFDGVALLVNTPFLVVASPDSGIKSMADLAKVAKSNPGKFNFSSAGKGNSTHLIMEMIEERMGIHLVHIPYNGAARGLSGVMAGEVQLMADVLNTAAVQAKAGKVVPLAVVGSKRATTVPDVSTMAEAGFNNFPQPGWFAMVAPAGTPKAILDRLNAETQKFFVDPGVRARLDALQYEPLPGRPELVKEWMQRDAKVWGPVLTRLGISND